VGLLDFLTRSRTLEQACELAMALADEGYWISLSSVDDLSADQLHRASIALQAAGVEAVSEISLPINSIADATWAMTPDLGWVFTGTESEALEPGVLSRLAAFTGRAGVVRAAALRSTESDCRAASELRVRLVGGDAVRGERDFYPSSLEVDKAYVRCAKALLRDSPAPSFATSDDRLIEILQALALRLDRAKGEYEFCLAHGRGENRQRALRDAGEKVRIAIAFEMRETHD
jgi:proline dehydrogenase